MALIGATGAIAGLSTDAASSGRGVWELIDPGADGPAAELITHDFPGVRPQPEDVLEDATFRTLTGMRGATDKSVHHCA